jgi:hypothetical protein
VLESFFSSADFFSSFFSEGLGVAFGSTLFFGVGFGVVFGVGLGDSVGAGVGLGFGRAVGVGVGEGSWISLFAIATLGAGSDFSRSAGVGVGAVRGSTAADASLFIHTTVSKFAGADSRLPRASARRTTR